MSQDPSALTRFVVRNPVLSAIASGGLLFLWSLALDLHVGVAAAGGGALALFTWFMWRRNGPGHRLRAYMLRRFPKKR